MKQTWDAALPVISLSLTKVDEHELCLISEITGGVGKVVMWGTRSYMFPVETPYKELKGMILDLFKYLALHCQDYNVRLESDLAIDTDVSDKILSIFGELDGGEDLEDISHQ